MTSSKLFSLFNKLIIHLDANKERETEHKKSASALLEYRLSFYGKLRR